MILTPTPSPWFAAVHCPFMSFSDTFRFANLLESKSLYPSNLSTQLLFLLRIFRLTCFDREKIQFLLAVFRISLIDRIQKVVKVENERKKSLKPLCNIEGPLKIHKDYNVINIFVGAIFQDINL